MKKLAYGEMDRVYTAGINLLRFICEKYNIKSKEELTCPLHRELWETIEEHGLSIIDQ